MAENNNLGELIPIRETNGQRAVNARDLHALQASWNTPVGQKRMPDL